MTTPSRKPKPENSFGSFAFGVAVGVGAALLLGTEEGRQFTSKLLDTVKDNLPPTAPRHSGLDPESSSRDLLSNPESTPHSTTYTPQSPTF
jgi:hypothetical protein